MYVQIEHSNDWLLCASPFQHHLKVEILLESEIWDLETKSGLFWDHFGTSVPFGTKSQIWDLFGAPEDDVLLRNHNTENLIMTVKGALYLPLPIHPIQSTFIALDCVQGAARGGARASLPFLHFGEHQWFITLDPYPNIIFPTPYPLLSICLTNPNSELSHSGKEATDPGLLQEHWLLKHLRLSLIPHSNAAQPPEQWPPIHKAFMPKTFTVFLRFT